MNEPNVSAERRVRALRSTPADRERRRWRAVRLLARGTEVRPRRPVGPLVVFGEVVTCLLPSAKALSRAELEELLAVVPGRPTQWRGRPISLAVSAAKLEGVDCPLSASAHAKVRAVGTVATHAVVVGGRVLQSSARSRVVRATGDQRKEWSHYLGRPGVMEVISRVTAQTGERLAEGFLAPGLPAEGTLDMTSIASRLLGCIRMDDRLDQDVPVQAGTTRLRWAARIGASAEPRVVFSLRNETIRTVLITVHSEDELAGVQRFCEDLAVHDWLLTAMAEALEQSDLFAPGSLESAKVLAPTLHHLAHLWAPGAHTPPELRGLWAQLQSDPDFDAGRLGLVDQLRNRVLVAALDAVRHNIIGGWDNSQD